MGSIPTASHALQNEHGPPTPLRRDLQPRTPVILITGVDDLADRQRALDEGAFDYLVKPIALTRLTATLERALNNRG